MGHDWIVDVLKDLQAYASSNGMPSLAAQLDDTEIVAKVEIASHGEGSGFGLPREGTIAGRTTGTVGFR